MGGGVKHWRPFLCFLLSTSLHKAGISSCSHTHITPDCVSSQSEIVVLMSQCGRTRRQIETWFRLRRSQDRPCQTKKFGEAAWVVQIVTTSPPSPHCAAVSAGLLTVSHFTSPRWRFFFYLASFTAGLACLIDVGFPKSVYLTSSQPGQQLLIIISYLLIDWFELFCVLFRSLGSGTCGNVGKIIQSRLEQLVIIWIYALSYCVIFKLYKPNTLFFFSFKVQGRLACGFGRKQSNIVLKRKWQTIVLAVMG